jgi:hypothetical protein
MKVYFTASIVGKKHFLPNYLAIINLLTSQNHSVISDHIINVTPEQVDHSSKNDRIKFHKNLEGWISSCDFMLVEASFPSMSVGYEISLALQRNKPVLILYSTGEGPSLFAEHENELLVCEKYSLDNVDSIIMNFINYAKGIQETRFTFYITSKIASHLEKKSKEEKVPKSVYLRQLIEKDMASER